MSALTIGRAGKSAGAVIDGVQRWDSQGDLVSVEFETLYGQTTAAAVLRQQLLGYTEVTDEEFVPVTWDEDPSANGYYRVLSVDVTPDPDLAFLGVYHFSVELQRVLSYATPLLEMHVTPADRPFTGFTMTDQRTAYAFPGTAKSIAWYALDLESWIPFAPDLTRVGADGNVQVFWQTGLGYLAQYFLAPAEHYVGAATILQGPTAADADLFPVVGRQTRDGSWTWRISNGLLQVEPVPGAARFQLRARIWRAGSGWQPWTTFGFAGSAPGGTRQLMLAPHAMTVLRNTPDEVVIRLLTTQGSFGLDNYSPVMVDVTLRRGMRHIAVDLQSVFTSDFALEASAFAAAGFQTPNYYVKRTATNTDMVVGSTRPIGQSGNYIRMVTVPNGSVSIGGDERIKMMVAFLDGSIGDPDSINNSWREYMGLASPRSTVVAQ